MGNRFVSEVAYWFKTIKAPSLKEKVDDALKCLEEEKPLEENQRKLLGFMLFSYSMNHGPASFIGIRFLTEDLGVEKEFKEYAQSWIDHSNKTKEENTVEAK